MEQIKFAKGFVEKIDDNGLITGAVASTGSMDRDGEILEPKGWVLDNFKKAPRLLWAHDAHQLPIGKVVRIELGNTGLEFDAEFAEKENEFAKKVADLFRGGFLNTFSVGFRPLERKDNTFLKQELLEISVVNVPANAEAMASREYKDFMKAEEKVFGRKETKSPACRMDGETTKECISRKIPEIMEEDDTIEQEQAVAIAINVCKEPCKSADIKSGRVISEKNRLRIKTTIDAIVSAKTALEELLEVSEVSEGEKSKVGTRIAEKDIPILQALRMVDKAVESAIHQIKGK